MRYIILNGAEYKQENIKIKKSNIQNFIRYMTTMSSNKGAK